MAKKYCYLMPDFPKGAFVIIPLFIIVTNVDIFPLYKIATSIDEVCDYMKDFEEEMKKIHEDLEVSENCIILPVTFDRLYPLKRIYWENPSVEYGYLERKHLFLELSLRPEVHELLITPSSYQAKDKSWEFAATLPLKIGTSNKSIEQFMLSSDAPVDERASYAAIYSVGKGQKLSWKTKQIETIDSIPSSHKSQN